MKLASDRAFVTYFSYNRNGGMFFERQVEIERGWLLL